MTQKELLYVEDAIGHEESIVNIFEDMVNTLEDEELVSFIKKEIKKHKNIYEKLISKLEDKSNE